MRHVVLALAVAAVGAAAVIIVEASATVGLRPTLSDAVSAETTPTTALDTSHVTTGTARLAHMPQVLNEPQVQSDVIPADMLLRLPKHGWQDAIDDSSVRLLQRHGDIKLFGGRDLGGELCALLLVPDSTHAPSLSAACVPPQNGFAQKGITTLNFVDGRSAFGMFLPDAVQTATADGRRLTPTRNGVLIVFDKDHTPSRVTATGRTGTLRISFTTDREGVPEFQSAGAF